MSKRDLMRYNDESRGRGGGGGGGTAMNYLYPDRIAEDDFDADEEYSCYSARVEGGVDGQSLRYSAIIEGGIDHSQLVLTPKAGNGGSNAAAAAALHSVQEQEGEEMAEMSDGDDSFVDGETSKRSLAVPSASHKRQASVEDEKNLAESGHSHRSQHSNKSADEPTTTDTSFLKKVSTGSAKTSGSAASSNDSKDQQQQQFNPMAALIQSERNRRLGITTSSDTNDIKSSSKKPPLHRRSKSDFAQPQAAIIGGGVLGNIRGWLGGGRGGGNAGAPNRDNMQSTSTLPKPPILGSPNRRQSSPVVQLNSSTPTQSNLRSQKSLPTQQSVSPLPLSKNQSYNSYTIEDEDENSSSSSSDDSYSSSDDDYSSSDEASRNDESNNNNNNSQSQKQQDADLTPQERARARALRYLSNSCVDAGRKAKTSSYVRGLERLDLKRKRDRYEKELEVVESEMNKDRGLINGRERDPISAMAAMLARELPRIQGADAGAGGMQGGSNDYCMTYDEYVDILNDKEDSGLNTETQPSPWENKGAASVYANSLQNRLKEALERTRSLEKRMVILEKAGDDIVASLCEDLAEVTGHANKTEARYVKRGKELQRKRRREALRNRNKIKQAERHIRKLEEQLMNVSGDGSNINENKLFYSDSSNDSSVSGDGDADDDEVLLEQKLSLIRSKSELDKNEHESESESLRRQCEQLKLRLSVARLVMEGDDNLREYVALLEKLNPSKHNRRASDEMNEEGFSGVVQRADAQFSPPSRITKARAKLLKVSHLGRIYEQRLAVSKAFTDATINALEQELVEREEASQKMEVRCLNELMLIDSGIKDIASEKSERMAQLEIEARELQDAISAFVAQKSMAGVDDMFTSNNNDTSIIEEQAAAPPPGVSSPMEGLSVGDSSVDEESITDAWRQAETPVDEQSMEDSSIDDRDNHAWRKKKGHGSDDDDSWFDENDFIDRLQSHQTESMVDDNLVDTDSSSHGKPMDEQSDDENDEKIEIDDNHVRFESDSPNNMERCEGGDVSTLPDSPEDHHKQNAETSSFERAVKSDEPVNDDSNDSVENDHADSSSPHNDSFNIENHRQYSHDSRLPLYDDSSTEDFEESSPEKVHAGDKRRSTDMTETEGKNQIETEDSNLEDGCISSPQNEVALDDDVNEATTAEDDFTSLPEKTANDVLDNEAVGEGIENVKKSDNIDHDELEHDDISPTQNKGEKESDVNSDEFEHDQISCTQNKDDKESDDVSSDYAVEDKDNIVNEDTGESKAAFPEKAQPRKKKDEAVLRGVSLSDLIASTNDLSYYDELDGEVLSRKSSSVVYDHELDICKPRVKGGDILEEGSDNAAVQIPDTKSDDRSSTDVGKEVAVNDRQVSSGARSSEKEKVLQLLGNELKCTLADYQTSYDLSLSSDRIDQLEYMNNLVLKIAKLSGLPCPDDAETQPSLSRMESWSHSKSQRRKSSDQEREKRKKKRSKKKKRRRDREGKEIELNKHESFDEFDTKKHLRNDISANDYSTLGSNSLSKTSMDFKAMLRRTSRGDSPVW